MNFDLNYDHLTPLEPAARVFCQMNGQDPDEQMGGEHPLLAGVKHTRPAWHFAAEALLNLTQMLTALKVGAQQPAPQTDPRQGQLFPN